MAQTTTQSKDLIDQLLDYKVVTLGDKKFEVLNQDALNLLDFRWLLRKLPRLNEIWEKDDPTTEEKAEFSELLKRFCRMILNAPAEVHETLNDFQRKQVLDFFLQNSPANPPQKAAVARAPKGSRSRGKNVSRG